MLRRFDQRQAETLAVRGSDEAGAGSVNFFEILIANAFEPEQAISTFKVVAEAFNQLIDHPTLFAHDDEIDIGIAPPKVLEGIQNLHMTLAGFKGADHQEGRALLQCYQNIFGVRRHARCGRGAVNICAERVCCNLK